VTFTVVYDNNRWDPDLTTAWGFACLVESGKDMVLFDTGGDGSMLLGNMARLGIDPQTIDVVVLSHIHDDHTGGLESLLDAGARPTVFIPASFPISFREGVGDRTEVVEVEGPTEILPGVRSSGQVGARIVEQALAVRTAEGWVVVTGCAHPGVVDMVCRIMESTGDEVTLVLGGFHLGSASRQQIEGVIAQLQQLGVERVAPCHCTGDLARDMFGDTFGSRCALPGAGWSISLPSE